ncbi:hypothetical protein EJB05_38498 [Eragrostis curvula]|uniref:H15 domain-containing protein n=1 Tax=Eragrostis curvula TaxID=38414 RepID=A0A5J9TUA4_9POAL|nr:hypothetical protein EJB05_38498 [Eragrostis curvula]
MVAAVAVETRQRAKRNKATTEEEGDGKTPPSSPPPPPLPAVRRHLQPTPDHPPYCWMIGEAIDALGEDGGSTEDSISSFIRARHPGVPAAHDRFLRHYLTKHVAEGFFVCATPGRYARSSNDEDAAVEAPAGASEATRVESPVVQPKRGRGRPRKDGSSSTSPAGKKSGSAGSATPKRRGRPRRAASLAASDGSVPASSVAAADKDGSQATAPAPRRRRRLRKLATSSDVSGEALSTDNEDGIDAPSATGKERGRSLELALVVVGDGTVDEVRGEAPPTTPVDGGQPGELALVTTTDMPAPMPPADTQDGVEDASFNLALVVKQVGISSTATAPEPSSQAGELALMAADDGPVPVLVADKKDIVEAPVAKCVRQLRKALPMVIAAQGSSPTSTSGKKKSRGKTLSATPKTRQQCKLALVATDVQSDPAPVAGKKAGSGVSVATLKLTPATAGGGNGAPSVAPKPHDRPSRLYPVTADELPDDPSCCLLALPAAVNA